MDALKNFANFTGKKPVLESLPNKVAGLNICNFIKKRLQHRCFSMKFHKFLRRPFFKEHLRWLLLEGVCKGTSLVKILRSCHFNIFGINYRCFRKMPIKGTVMQIIQKQIYDHLNTNNKDWNFRIHKCSSF